MSEADAPTAGELWIQNAVYFDYPPFSSLLLGLSARAYDRILRISRTIAIWRQPRGAGGFGRLDRVRDHDRAHRGVEEGDGAVSLEPLARSLGGALRVVIRNLGHTAQKEQVGTDLTGKLRPTVHRH